MKEKLTLSTRRARRRFSTRTTGVRRRGLLTRWMRILKGQNDLQDQDDYEIPEDVVRSDIHRSNPFRGNIDDLFHPEPLFFLSQYSAFCNTTYVQQHSTIVALCGKRLSRSFCNAFSNLQRQSCIPGASQHH